MLARRAAELPIDLARPPQVTTVFTGALSDAGGTGGQAFGHAPRQVLPDHHLILQIRDAVDGVATQQYHSELTSCLVGHAANPGDGFSDFRTGLDHLEFFWRAPSTSAG